MRFKVKEEKGRYVIYDSLKDGIPFLNDKRFSDISFNSRELAEGYLFAKRPNGV